MKETIVGGVVRSTVLESNKNKKKKGAMNGHKKIDVNMKGRTKK